MNQFEAIMDDRASTVHEKLLAKKANERRNTVYSKEIHDNDLNAILHVAHSLDLTVEHTTYPLLSSVLYGKKKSVKQAVRLLSVWDQNSLAVNDAICKELYRSLPHTSQDDSMVKTNLVTSYIKTSKMKSSTLTDIEKEQVDFLLKWIREAK